MAIFRQRFGAGRRVVVALALAVIRIARRDGRGDLAVSAAVAASLAAGPLSLDFHFTTALLPVGLLIAAAARESDGAAGIAGATASVLIGAPFPLLAPLAGALAVLSYPKLLGAWLLVGGAWRLASRSDAAHEKGPGPS